MMEAKQNSPQSSYSGQSETGKRGEAISCAENCFTYQRPVIASQEQLQSIANQSNQVTQAASIQRMADVGVMQRMKVRGANTNSTVSGPTSNKHVVATANHQATADAAFGDSTFVTSAADLTTPVDADNHDFLEANRVASARYDFNANVNIYQYNKSNAPPGGLAKGQPTAIAINNASTSCEIGVEKKGDDTIKVTHFKKN